MALPTGGRAIDVTRNRGVVRVPMAMSTAHSPNRAPKETRRMGHDPPATRNPLPRAVVSLPSDEGPVDRRPNRPPKSPGRGGLSDARLTVARAEAEDVRAGLGRRVFPLLRFLAVIRSRPRWSLRLRPRGLPARR